MEKQIQSLRDESFRQLDDCASLKEIEALRVRLLGRKGQVTALLRSLGSAAPEERAGLGRLVNCLKSDIAVRIEERREALARDEESRRFKGESADVTLPGVSLRRGTRHPLSQVMETIVGIFAGLGFTVEEGPEAETEYYNFQALNFPPDHPARDMQDTLYIGDDLLLRTHTSPVQIRVMERQQPPVRCIMPGPVYRCDYDVSHSPMFHQVEGLYIDRGVNFGQLKGILAFFVRRMFGRKTRLRFRPSFFPFTEPSAEIDISCVICAGRGCRVCSHSGWLEILGAGMVHPAVFEAVGYDPEEYTGYAFGMGVERIAMLKYRIDDIRMFFENDVRFLEQFK